MTNPSGLPPGFARDVNAVLDAFRLGAMFDPPAIGFAELRGNLRRAGMELGPDDALAMPEFQAPELPREEPEDPGLAETEEE